MPIWKMVIEIVPVVTAKPDNVISTRKRITMMKIMMMRITMKMMKTIMKKVAGEAEVIMEI